MEESKELQGFYRIFRAVVYVGKSSVSCPLKPSDSAPLC